MVLTIERIMIKDVKIGRKTGINQGILEVSADSVIELLKEDHRIKEVALDVAKPGESVRILPVKDVIEPRAKNDGGGFPGLVGNIEGTGEGITRVLKGCAVATTGPIVGFQEGIIDMSGPGAVYTPFSQLNLLVVHITREDWVSPHEHEAAVREAGVKTAHYLASATMDHEPDDSEMVRWEPLTTKQTQFPLLPKVMLVYPCMSQGLLHDTYFYGLDSKKMIPTLISPLDVLDGALVSGNCVSPGSKTTTWHHQNNALIQECFRRDGTEINFIGVVLTPLQITLAEKIRNAEITATIVQMMGTEGVVQSQEGFGNPTTDLMMICKQLENRGIKTVLISNEDAGVDGRSESLPDGTPEANAIISTGNSNATLLLPPMNRTIGDPAAIERITGGFSGSIQPDGGLLVEIHGIMGSHNLQGNGTLSAVTR
jgi:glycine reductase complex component B subunit alpha and beta